jgi:Flp pilus assembly protein TadG
MRVLREEHGQALIETALSVSLFVVILMGAVEFGRLAFTAIEVADAAQAAAQYATQNSATAQNITAMQTAAQNEYYTPSDLTLLSPTTTSGYACTCANSGASVSCSNNSLSSPSCPGSFEEVTVTVQTQATYIPTIHIPGLATSYQIRGNATRKVLQ